MSHHLNTKNRTGIGDGRFRAPPTTINVPLPFLTLSNRRCTLHQKYASSKWQRPTIPSS
jgi:hypothetical protein